MSKLASMQRQFAGQLECPCYLHQLFECLPDTYFYAKNAQGQFVMANQALAGLLGLKSAEDLIGQTDHDLSPADLADQYVAEDRHVMRTGEPVINQSWLVADHRGVSCFPFKYISTSHLLITTTTCCQTPGCNTSANFSC